MDRTLFIIVVSQRSILWVKLIFKSLSGSWWTEAVPSGEVTWRYFWFTVLLSQWCKGGLATAFRSCKSSLHTSYPMTHPCRKWCHTRCLSSLTYNNTVNLISDKREMFSEVQRFEFLLLSLILFFVSQASVEWYPHSLFQFFPGPLRTLIYFCVIKCSKS